VVAPVRAFVATAMAKNPADRYPTAAAMAAAAQALVLASTRSRTPRSSPPPR
jgi:serine/threonine-protein kinase